MDERRVSEEQEGRRKKPENPLLQTEEQKNQRKTDRGTRERAQSRRAPAEDTEKRARESGQNVYKLRILTIILVLLIIALIAAFVSEIGIYGKPDSRTKGNSAATPVQTEQQQKTEPVQAEKTDADKGGLGVGGSLAGL